jgi:putative SOS response-associated peptidase YedK
MAKYFQASLADGVDPEGTPSWNVGPTRDLLAITMERPRPLDENAAGGPEPGPADRILSTYRWGLVPSWAKDPSVGSRLFNARAETVATRTSFRGAFESRRAVVAVDGFFEWHKAQGSGRQPHYFKRVDDFPLALAGLYEFWRDPRNIDGGTGWMRSCTIITTRASQDMDGIHDRMPVVLDQGTVDLWLDPNSDDRRELEALLSSPAVGTLTHHLVDTRVGNVRNDDPGLIAEVSRRAERKSPMQQSLLDPEVGG